MDKLVLSNAASLLQSRHSLLNSHVYMAVVDEFVKFVGVDDVLWYFIEADAHVLVAGHGGSVVEVADVRLCVAGTKR